MRNLQLSHKDIKLIENSLLHIYKKKLESVKRNTNILSENERNENTRRNIK